MRESFDCVSALGERLRLEVIEHGDSGASKEFIVAAPKFNFKKWLTMTVALSCISLTCELYISDLRVLGAILCFLCFALLIKLHKKIKLESLLVVSSLGLQHTTMYASGRRETFFLSRQRLKSVLIVEGISMQKVLFYLTIVLNPNRDLPPLLSTATNKNRDALTSAPPNSENRQRLLNKMSEQERSAPDFPSTHNAISSLVYPDCEGRISTDHVVYPLFQSLWPRLDVLTLVYQGVQKTLFTNNS